MSECDDKKWDVIVESALITWKLLIFNAIPYAKKKTYLVGTVSKVQSE